MAGKSVNKVFLIGNLGRDPEIRYAASGTAIVNVSLATAESSRNKQTGDWDERTEWHRLVFFGKIAEIAGQYLRKGSKIHVEGSLRTSKWTDKDGHERYTTEIIVSEMLMLDKRGDGPDGFNSPGSGVAMPLPQNKGVAAVATPHPSAAPAPSHTPQQPTATPASTMGAPIGDDDDIPF